jgi:hypothetical protein
VIREDPSDLPPVALRGGFKLALLVLDALPIGADPDVDRYPLILGHGCPLADECRRGGYRKQVFSVPL